MDGSPDLEYLQFSFTGQCTFDSTAPSVLSDRLIAKGRRVLARWMTATWKPMLPVGSNVVNWHQGLTIYRLISPMGWLHRLVSRTVT